MPYFNARETGRPVKIKDEGLTLVNNVGSLDFVGAGVTATNIGDDVEADIPGGTISGTEVVNETPTGTQDGVNTDFTLANTPTLVRGVYRGGAWQSEGDDYTISTNTITFIIPPVSGENIRVSYVY